MNGAIMHLADAETKVDRAFAKLFEPGVFHLLLKQKSRTGCVKGGKCPSERPCGEKKKRDESSGKEKGEKSIQERELANVSVYKVCRKS